MGAPEQKVAPSVEEQASAYQGTKPCSEADPRLSVQIEFVYLPKFDTHYRFKLYSKLGWHYPIYFFQGGLRIGSLPGRIIGKPHLDLDSNRGTPTV